MKTKSRHDPQEVCAEERPGPVIEEVPNAASKAQRIRVSLALFAMLVGALLFALGVGATNYTAGSKAPATTVQLLDTFDRTSAFLNSDVTAQPVGTDLTDLSDRHTPEELQRLLAGPVTAQPVGTDLTDLSDRHTPEELQRLLAGPTQ